MMRMTTFKQGDVWIAKVYFRNKGLYKNRPVVVVGTELIIDIDVLSAPVLVVPRGANTIS